MVTFDERMRDVVLAAIREVSNLRGWRLWAAHVRTQHLHLVVSSLDDVKKVMVDYKARSTRLLRDAHLAGSTQKVWARHGSTRHLWDEQSVEDACWYVLFEQGNPMASYDGRNHLEL